MPWIHNKEQIEIVRKPLRGHRVVLGAAGTGKSIIAMAKIAELKNIITADKKILYVSFNKALIRYAESILGDMERFGNLVDKDGIRFFGTAEATICNYHKIAFKILGLHASQVIKDDLKEKGVIKRRDLIKKALEIYRKKFPENVTYKRSLQIFASEIAFMEKIGYVSFDEYNDASRIGRKSINVARGEARQCFWNVYQEYVRLYTAAGFLCDFDGVAKLMYERFKDKKIPDVYKYDYIIVDEGQDMPPMMLKSILLLLREDRIKKNYGFMFLGDTAQQIYGSKLSWKDIGLNITGSGITRLTTCYRYTKEIAQFALDVTKSEYWDKDTPDMVLPETINASGPLPQLIKYNGFADEIETIKKIVAKNIEAKASTCIVVTDKKAVQKWHRNFLGNGFDVQLIDGNMESFDMNHLLSISTFYSVKGLEFDYVIIPDLDAKNLPTPQSLIGVEDSSDAYDIACKLLYVAITRAKKAVLVTYLEELTPVFPYAKRHFEEIPADKASKLVNYIGKKIAIEDKIEHDKKILEDCLGEVQKSRKECLTKDEILVYLDKALHDSTQELDIQSPWMSREVVDELMKDKLERLLIHKVVVKILYGIGDPNNKLNKKNAGTEKLAEEIREYFKHYPNFKMKRVDSHAKLLISDNQFIINTSFNLLSYGGQGTREENGALDTDKEFIKQSRNKFFNF